MSFTCTTTPTSGGLEISLSRDGLPAWTETLEWHELARPASEDAWRTPQTPADVLARAAQWADLYAQLRASHGPRVHLTPAGGFAADWLTSTVDPLLMGWEAVDRDKHCEFHRLQDNILELCTVPVPEWNAAQVLALAPEAEVGLSTIELDTPHTDSEPYRHIRVTHDPAWAVTHTRLRWALDALEVLVDYPDVPSSPAVQVIVLADSVHITCTLFAPDVLPEAWTVDAVCGQPLVLPAAPDMRPRVVYDQAALQAGAERALRAAGCTLRS